MSRNNYEPHHAVTYWQARCEEHEDHNFEAVA